MSCSLALQSLEKNAWLETLPLTRALCQLWGSRGGRAPWKMLVWHWHPSSAFKGFVAQGARANSGRQSGGGEAPAEHRRMARSPGTRPGKLSCCGIRIFELGDVVRSQEPQAQAHGQGTSLVA